MEATAVLAAFASGIRLPDISIAAIAATKRHILDCVGVALAAAVEPAGRIILDITQEQGGAAQARVLGSSLRTSAVSAAWANGALAHLLDFDDTGFSHPTACILPAALAMAEGAGASGGDLVTAVCVGLEVFRTAVAIRPATRAGAAAARLPSHVVVWVFGRGRRGGQHRRTEPHPDGRRHRTGSGQRRRVDATFRHLGQGHSRRQRGARRRDFRVAGAGKTTSPTSRASRADYGFFSAFHGAGNYDLGKVADGLGTHWSIVDPGLTVKSYPCCGGNLRALDAAQALLRENDIRFDDVAKLEVDVHPDLLHIVRFHKPTQGFRGKFSIDYVLAAMLLDGRVDLDSFTDAYCNAPRMRASLEKVRVNAHPEWPNDQASRRNSPVTITMNDGGSFTKAVDKVRGSPGNPMTRDELVGKYRGCASRVLDADRLAQSITALEKLDRLPTATDL